MTEFPDSPYVLDGTREVGIDIRDCTSVVISKDLANELNICYSDLEKNKNVLLYKGRKIFYKRPIGTKYLVNELLGVVISHYMGLDTIQYKIGFDEFGICGLFSENFRKPGVKYLYSTKLNKEQLMQIKKLLLTQDNSNPLFKDELARYLLRNVYASSNDREGNVLCKETSDGLRLATIFDYENSLSENSAYLAYTDYLFIKEISSRSIPITFDSALLVSLLKKDHMKMPFEMIMSFDMKRALDCVEEEHQIGITHELKRYYLMYDDKRKKYLKSLK